LTQGVPQRSDSYFAVSWHNRGANALPGLPEKLHVAALLAGLDKTG
jgi:hypothetical protein